MAAPHPTEVIRTNIVCILGFCVSCVAYAQSPLGYGVKGGLALTNAYDALTSGTTAGITSNGKDYIVGPFIELRLPFGVGVEADALYQSVNLKLSTISGALITGNHMSWEFPILAKYHFPVPAPIVKPLVEAGPAFRAHSSSLPDLKANGFVLGGGVEFKLPLIRVSSELRYTRWASPSAGATSNPNLNQAELLFGIAF